MYLYYLTQTEFFSQTQFCLTAQAQCLEDAEIESLLQDGAAADANESCHSH